MRRMIVLWMEVFMTQNSYKEGRDRGAKSGALLLKYEPWNWDSQNEAQMQRAWSVPWDSFLILLSQGLPVSYISHSEQLNCVSPKHQATWLLRALLTLLSASNPTSCSAKPICLSRRGSSLTSPKKRSYLLPLTTVGPSALLSSSTGNT